MDSDYLFTYSSMSETKNIALRKAGTTICAAILLSQMAIPSLGTAA